MSEVLGKNWLIVEVEKESNTRWGGSDTRYPSICDLSQSLYRTGPTCRAIPACFAEGSTPRRCGVPLAATFSCAVAAHRHESRVGVDWGCSVHSGISNRNKAGPWPRVACQRTQPIPATTETLSIWQGQSCSQYAQSEICPVREWPDCRLAANAVFTREIHGRLRQVQVIAISWPVLPRRFLGEFGLVTEGNSEAFRQKTTPIDTRK